MAGPEARHPGQPNRLSGEDAPTWLILGFAAIGTLVAGAAAWLAVTGQPATAPAARGEPAREHSAKAPLPAGREVAGILAPERESRSEPVSPAGDARSAAPTSLGAPDDARPAAYPDERGQRAAVQRATSQEVCPAPIHIPFKRDSARPLTHDVQTALDDLRVFLERHAQARLSIEGHADSLGTEDYNLLLSYRRAKAVVSLLSSAGLSEKRMVLRAAGDNVPLEGLSRDSAKNRRVVVEVLDMNNCGAAPDARLP
jgi:outer membrane protein OmpA-like peptidoglycan-associated protein